MSPTYFLTGVTGTVGAEVRQALLATDPQARIIIAQRDPHKDTGLDLSAHPNVETRYFDFEDPDSFDAALQGATRVFFMRPPRLAKESTFAPFVKALENIKPEIVTFLSVAGAERVKVLPHAKIEALLAATTLPTYIVRPEYFMSNLLIVFGEEIRTQKRVTLPSKSARFNWIAPVDIGVVVAHSLEKPAGYTARATHLTGPDNYDFAEVCSLLSQVLGYSVAYRPVSPLEYALRRPHASSTLEGVMFTLIHTVPRFFPAPTITTAYEDLTGTAPTTLAEFLSTHQAKFRA